MRAAAPGNPIQATESECTAVTTCYLFALTASFTCRLFSYGNSYRILNLRQFPSLPPLFEA